MSCQGEYRIKMTEAEFRSVLNMSGISFDTRGYEGILNLVAIAYKAMAKETPYVQTRQRFQNRHDALEDYLKCIGYHQN